MIAYWSHPWSVHNFFFSHSQSGSFFKQVLKYNVNGLPYHSPPKPTVDHDLFFVHRMVHRHFWIYRILLQQWAPSCNIFFSCVKYPFMTSLLLLFCSMNLSRCGPLFLSVSVITTLRLSDNYFALGEIGHTIKN